jgi:hypothetical protein
MTANRNSFAAKAHLYFSIIMVAVYILIGLLLIFVLKFIQIQPSNRIAAGCVLILYAVFRSYKLIRERRELLSSTHRENDSL